MSTAPSDQKPLHGRATSADSFGAPSPLLLGKACVATALALTVLGCASTKTGIDLPPQSVGPEPTQLGEEIPEALPQALEPLESPPQAVEQQEPRPSTPPQDPTAARQSSSPRTLVALDRKPDGSPRASDVVEAARRERERRKSSPGPALVITNENLSELASRGNMTRASGPEPSTSEPIQVAETLERETYWRQRVRTARLQWRQSVDSIRELEGRANELRTQFYSQDDPFVRDARIKPEWDYVLDKLQEARQSAEAAQIEVAAVLEQGRRGGALPGWLREGLELEPRPEELPAMEESSDFVEPGEPVVID